MILSDISNEVVFFDSLHILALLLSSMQQQRRTNLVVERLCGFLSKISMAPNICLIVCALHKNCLPTTNPARGNASMLVSHITVLFTNFCFSATFVFVILVCAFIFIHLFMSCVCQIIATMKYIIITLT